MAQDQNRIWVVWLSLLAALLLTIVPIPSAIEIYRPQWLALFLIYWTIALPERISVGHGFLFGLLLDVLTGTTMGENALSLSLITLLPTKRISDYGFPHTSNKRFRYWRFCLSKKLSASLCWE